MSWYSELEPERHDELVAYVDVLFRTEYIVSTLYYTFALATQRATININFEQSYIFRRLTLYSMILEDN